VAELPQQLIPVQTLPIQTLPIQTLPFQHATVQHDIFPIQHQTVLEQQELHHAAYPAVQTAYTHTFPIQQHVSFPIQKSIVSFPSKYHY
jgi:hypothetical protein